MILANGKTPEQVALFLLSYKGEVLAIAPADTVADAGRQGAGLPPKKKQYEDKVAVALRKGARLED
jgi:hypothetical protein